MRSGERVDGRRIRGGKQVLAHLGVMKTPKGVWGGTRVEAAGPSLEELLHPAISSLQGGKMDTVFKHPSWQDGFASLRSA